MKKTNRIALHIPLSVLIMSVVLVGSILSSHHAVNTLSGNRHPVPVSPFNFAHPPGEIFGHNTTGGSKVM